MKVEYLEPFIRGADMVLKEFSIGVTKTGELGLMGSTFSTAMVNITTRIDGSLRGDVVYSMSTATAKKISEKVTGISAQVFGRRMGKGLAELGNVLAEKTAGLLLESGFSCEFSRPTVFQGMNVEFSAVAPALAVPIDTDVGRVEVSVAVNDGEQN